MSGRKGARTHRAIGRSDVERHVRDVCFAASDAPDLVGMEVELIPVDRRSRRPAPVDPEEGSAVSTRPVLARLGERLGWTARTSPVGVPGFDLPGGGRISFEPGGQIEYSSPPRRSVDAMLGRMEPVLREIVSAGRTVGLDFLARGADPVGPTTEARLRVSAERYRRMADHYDRRGPWGRRMMRQTAAIHVNVDLGPRPVERWRVATRAAAPLLAAFANSPRAEGRETGHRSWRAAQWRSLDPGRTGLPGATGDPVAGYADFVLGADAFLLGAADEPARPFGAWLDEEVDEGDLRAHLTTLFPEVRPRGYLELRFFDALPLRWLPVPPVVVAGLLYDPETLEAALDRLPEPRPGELELAGREGVRDPGMRRRALEVLDLAIEGAERLPRGMAGVAPVATARDFRNRMTARGRDPGDEPGDGPL